MILQTKKLDELFIFLFINAYLILGVNFKFELCLLISYVILHCFSKSVNKLRIMKKNGFKMNNEMLYYSKSEKMRLYLSLPLIILGVGFNVPFFVILAYILFILTYFIKK